MAASILEFGENVSLLIIALVPEAATVAASRPAVRVCHLAPPAVDDAADAAPKAPPVLLEAKRRVRGRRGMRCLREERTRT